MLKKWASEGVRPGQHSYVFVLLMEMTMTTCVWGLNVCLCLHL